MRLERTENEILIRISSNVDLSELQSMIDYLEYKELTASSKADQKDADELADKANQSIWSKIKKKRGFE